MLKVPIVEGEVPPIVVGEPALHMVPISRMICGNCGYIEQWVDDPKDLEKLRQEYGR